MNGPLKGTPHVDYCLLTAPGVCVQLWDLMCSSTFVQGVVITVVTVCRNLELNTIYTCCNYDVMPCAYQYEILVHTWRCEQLVEPERWHLCSDMAICQS